MSGDKVVTSKCIEQTIQQRDHIMVLGTGLKGKPKGPHSRVVQPLETTSKTHRFQRRTIHALVGVFRGILESFGVVGGDKVVTSHNPPVHYEKHKISKPTSRRLIESYMLALDRD